MSILDQASSDRLNLIRFPLIIGVVFIHAYKTVVGFSGTESLLTPGSFAGNLFRDFISIGLAGTAVPLFFFMSGFLFFNSFNWSRGNYLLKVRSRISTLLVPFLVWNLLWLGLIAVAQNIPFIAQYFSGGIPSIIKSGPYDIINLLIGIDRHPVAFQFWYIRDLMILVMLVPLIHLIHIHKKISVVILVFFFGIWMTGVPYDAPLSIIPGPIPVFFFYAGSILAVNNKSPFFLDKYGLLMIPLFLIFTGIGLVFEDSAFSEYFLKAGRLAGVFAALYSTGYFLSVEKVRRLFAWLAGASFFVFAFHEPVMEILQRLVLVIWNPGNDAERLLFYLVFPVLIIAIAVLVYSVLSRFLPGFTAFITGGRLHGQLEKAQKTRLQ